MTSTRLLLQEHQKNHPITCMQKESKSLSHKAFAKSAEFLRAQARPLEVARFENIFNGSTVEDVLNELREFQNSDGGFGHALEADLRTPESSALCTSVAFQIIRDHQISREHEIVQRGIHYLMETLDRSETHWRIIPESAGASPHAPWWNQKGREEEYSGFSLNPTAEILGYVFDYGEAQRDERIISEITDRVIDSLRLLKSVGMHDLLCCLRLLDTENLPPSAQEGLERELGRLIPEAVATTPEQWRQYGLRPLLVVRRPDSPFFNRLEEAVSLNLDFELKEQASNGSWCPTWSWGGDYPDLWERARQEWSGVLTLDKLVTLTHFDRIQKNA
ncbi:MAG: hypothetical protein F6K48_32665 [Okeania sp. SIO3H1]|nr:hypothetical protein [Okeania sp. SIO3H1]